MRRLIINADDLGLTSGVNQSIKEGHHAGIITSTTLMANSPRFEDAVRVAKSSPKLGVGCHVTLVDAAPILKPSEVTSLLAPGKHSFRQSAADFARAAARRQLSPQEITEEAEAQISRLQQAGIAVTHVDTHKHTHMFPSVLQPLLRSAKSRDIKAVRNPFAPLHIINPGKIVRHPELWLRYLQVKMLHRYTTAFQREVEQAGMRTTDGTFGIIATGFLSEELFATIISSIPDGTWEFVCHPGYNDTELQQAKMRLQASRAIEHQILTSPASRELLDRCGIQLINFADI